MTSYQRVTAVSLKRFCIVFCWIEYKITWLVPRQENPRTVLQARTRTRTLLKQNDHADHDAHTEPYTKKQVSISSVQLSVHKLEHSALQRTAQRLRICRQKMECVAQNAVSEKITKRWLDQTKMFPYRLFRTKDTFCSVIRVKCSHLCVFASAKRKLTHSFIRVSWKEWWRLCIISRPPCFKDPHFPEL